MKNAIRFALLLASAALAQRPDVNYDEANVPKYTLPDPLILQNGERVRDVQTWQTRRRPQIVQLFETHMIGRAPGRPKNETFELAAIDNAALGGKAVRKEVTINVDKPLRLLLYLPSGSQGPVPVFVGLNFGGNQTVAADAGISPSDVWVMDRQTKVTSKQRATEKSRGAGASQWQVERILGRGYGLATIYYGDIEPDFDGGMQYGVRPLFFKPGQTAPAADEWGAIGAWAWGLSRAVDYLETDKAVDSKRIALIGHSRLGKAALWAGASDPRFALVISNESGEGGAAISRRKFGEMVKDLNTRFPHWFCGNYRQYDEREDEMPVDSNLLLALMAPRPLYVASAEEDRWSDPRGEFLGAVAAGRVYELFGKRGIGTDRMPANHEPLGDTVRYHVRAGKHDVTEYDWQQYLDFADRQLRVKP